MVRISNSWYKKDFNKDRVYENIDPIFDNKEINWTCPYDEDVRFERDIGVD